MAQAYESNVTKVGGNLQKTVAYLLSLHKAEYEWNMLGIKVIGHVDALPIPDGTYEYGDTYMVGTTTPYDMWIYTRADEFHSTAYWFNVGKFPQPGPQGPAGPGLDDIASIDMSALVENVIFDTTNGITISGNGSINNDYDISTEYDVPLVPGKYINMEADPSHSKVQVRVDDENLALDYYKINRTIQKTVIPFWNGKNSSHTELTVNPVAYSAVLRNYDGDSFFNKIGADIYCNSNLNDAIPHRDMMRTVEIPDNAIPETSTDTGVLTATQYEIAKAFQNTRIIYKNQLYYCMDPRTAPDGTLNFVHLDIVQTGGGYAARGKCFSITTSTQAWQVVDMSFGPRTHQLTITDNVTNAKTYMTIVSNQSIPYTADELITEMGERSFPCTHDSVQDDNIYAGVISALDSQFTVRYSNNQEFNMTDSQVTITDYVV